MEATMKGHIRKRSKGSWSIVIDRGKDPYTDKRRQQWHTIKGTKRDAERALRDMLSALDNGTYVKPTQITLAEWLEQWFDSYVVSNTTPRTQESYYSIINKHIIPHLGTIPLMDLRPQYLQNYYALLLKKGRTDNKGGLSRRTVLYIHHIISKSLKHAVKMGLLARNIADAISPPKAERAKIATMMPDDTPKFLDAAATTKHFVFFVTLLYTGLRRGELLALRWKYLDLAMAILHVVESAYKLSNGTYIVKEPKTKHSQRAVSLSPSLSLLLQQHRETQEKLFAKLGRQLTDDDFVFTRDDGSPINPNTITLAFRRILKKAGIPHIRVHDLRHTHATLMLKAGVHPKVVSERLGHANVLITLDTYSHVLPGLQEAAAERFDQLLDGAIKEASKEDDVSKMLAKPEGSNGEPRWIKGRTFMIEFELTF